MAKSTPIDIDCIIPAAGLSSRMGAWKLTLPYNNGTILETSIKQALSACSRVILVAGYRANELVETLGAYPNVKIVVNEDYEQGMFSSIKTGIKHVTGDYFFIAHADMPCINSEIYHKLWNARAQGAVFPGDENHSGHPVLISSSLKKAVLSESQSKSMKPVLRRFPMTFLSMTDPGIHFDIDTPQAYEKLLNKQK